MPAELYCWRVVLNKEAERVYMHNLPVVVDRTENIARN
jgi:hypothetical protein